MVELVAGLALLQYVAFAVLVAQARGKYGVKAPAIAGHEMFERYYRVQMNTLELLVVLLPGLWLANKYWSPNLVAGLGLVYLIGRIIYLRAYTRDPASRSLGFTLSILPALLLLLGGMLGAVLQGIK